MQCYFCSRAQNYIDYKDVETLRRFMSFQGKITPPKRSGTCPKHQRKLAQAIKRARHLALLPYTTR